MKKPRTPIYLKDAQKFLDECISTRELVNLTVLKLDGTKVEYKGWQVLSSHWKRGTHDLINPYARERIRKVIDVLIFEINGHQVYI